MREAEKRSMVPAAPLAAVATIGTPLAVVIVWYLNAYVLPSPMPDGIATAAGSVIAGAVGYCMQIVEVLVSKLRG